MIVEKEIRTYLLTRADLTALIGDRIYAGRLPQAAVFPCFTYAKISEPRIYSQDGGDGLKRPRIQYTSWSKSYGEAKEAADQLITEMAGVKGTMGVAEVQASFVENTIDLFDPEAELYYNPVDLIIWYNG